MKRELITRTSDALGKDMSLIAYGEVGYPVIAFQPQGSKCNAFEDFGMVEALADFIESGTIRLFSVDNNDEESWSDTNGDKAARAARQEAYFTYMTDELVPLVHELVGSDERPLAIGCSMGATHAALAALRRPDLFQGCIALSGIYDARYYFGDWMDATLYDNSIASFLPNMAPDHPYIELYGKRNLVFCVGQGAWEDQGIADLRIVADTCHEKGIDAWCDFWGFDVSHDWPWWKKQITYFLPIVLNDMDKSLADERAAAKKPVRKAAKKAAATVKKTARKGATTAKAAAAKVEAAAEKAKASAERTADKVVDGAKKTASKAAGKAEQVADAAKTDVAATTAKALGDAKTAMQEAKADAKKAETTAKKATRRAASTVKKDAESLAEKAEAAATQTKAATKRGATRAKTTAKKAAASAKETADEVVADAKATASKAKAATKTAATKTATKARAAAAKVEEKVEGAAAK